MQLQDKVAIVTGGGSGIGAACCERFRAEGARHVVVVDKNAEAASEVAAKIGGTGVGLDVASEEAVTDLVARTERDHGAVDVFFSNAGYVTVGGLEVDTEEIQKMWEVHALSHVFAARAAIPGMVERGSGYIVSTASAAGLLTQLGSLAYSITKSAAVSVAEWIAITHAHQGIRVSVLCPQAVATNIAANSPSNRGMGASAGVASGDGVLSSEEAAEVVVRAMDQERFWILPHPEVAEYTRRKGTDIDRWLAGMRRFQDSLFGENPLPATWLTGGDKPPRS